MNDSFFFECLEDAVADNASADDSVSVREQEGVNAKESKYDGDARETADQILVAYIAVRERCQDLRAALADRMKEGYVQLARARFRSDRLVKDLGAASYSMRVMRPQRRCVVDTDASTSPHLTLATTTTSSSLESPKPALPRSQLKHRGKATTTSSSSASAAASTEPEDDPLRWFGVRLPLEVSSAQREFRRALELAVSLAQAQAQLLSLEQRFVLVRPP